MGIEKIKNLAMDSSITKFVEKSIIPIILYIDDNETGKSKAVIQGTGTLFKFIDNYFLITAAHVLEPIDEYYEKNIGIPVGKNNSDIIKLHNCKRYLLTDKEISDKYDFGIIQLNNELGKKLEQDYYFLTENNISFRLYDKMIIYITGYPNKWTVFNEKENVLGATPFKFLSRRKVQKKEYTKYDPNAHILAEYAEVYYLGGDVNRYVNAEKKLNSISGCSMWVIENNQTGIWSAEKCVKVIGIQSNVMENEYIKGTKWIYLAEAFKNIDENIFNLLYACREKQLQNYS